MEKLNSKSTKYVLHIEIYQKKSHTDLVLSNGEKEAELLNFLF